MLPLARTSADQAVRVRVVGGDIVSSSERQFTLTVSLSTHVCKWVLVNLMLGVTQN